MSQPEQIPTLLKLMFGEAAPAALASASERLLAWAQAFEAWLEGCKLGNYRLYRISFRAWKYLVTMTKAPPWAITTSDIERYRDGLLERGLTNYSTRRYMRAIHAFYEWCRLRPVEAGCGPFSNPARGVTQPKVGERYTNAKMLSPQEAQALLEVLKADECPLSRRDYAFFLSRLRLGVPNKLLRQLKWGQIELRDGHAWVAWAPGKPLSLMPVEVWEAVLGYLEAAGRLGLKRPGGLPPGAYIFAPLVKVSLSPGSGLAEEWDERRCLTADHQKKILKIYGGLAGIDREKLTLPALRHTAVARYLEAARSPAEIEAFLGSPPPRQARRHTRDMQALQKQQPASDFEAKLSICVRSRKSHIYTARESFKHGLYARYLLPPEQVQAIMDEEITGMKEETDGLEILLDKLVERLEEPGLSERAILELGEAHSMCTVRIKELFDFENDELQGLSPEDAQALQTYQGFWELYALPGSSEPTLENVRYWAEADDPDGAVVDERLMRRIAAERLILRNLQRVALEKSDPLAYANLVQNYGRRCQRLCKLLRKARPESGRIHAWVWKEIEGYIAEAWEALGKMGPLMVPGWTGPWPPPSGPPPGGSAPSKGEAGEQEISNVSDI